MTKESTKTANPILNAIAAFGVGTSVLGGVATLTVSSFDLTTIYTQMFNGMFLSFDNLIDFWSVFGAWALAGMVAGVRAKNGFWGAIAGFFGTLLGVGLISILNLTALENSTAILEFGLGTAACILVTCATAFIIGSAIKVKPKPAKPKPTRKAWAASKEKEVWVCRKCGTNIPPGAFSCPNCGEPVIE
ncbi:MAG: hypothetical protein ACFFB5_16365 [Promethearchaeota archaeon]